MTASRNTVTVEGGKLVLRARGPSSELVEAIMRLPAKTFRDRDNSWVMPMACRPGVLRLADQFGFSVDPHVIDPPKASRTIDRRVSSGAAVVDLVGGQIELDPGPGLSAIEEDAVKSLRGSRFNHQRRRWQIPSYLVRVVRELSAEHSWVSTPSFDGLNDADPTAKPVTIHADQGMLVVSFPYDASLVGIMKKLHGASWSDRAGGWLVPVEAGFDLMNALNRLDDLNLSQHAGELLGQTRRMLDRISESRALDGDVHVEGLALELRPFQQGGVAYMADVRRVLNGDDMGLGKTPQALATIQYTNSWPAVVICPASVKVNWMIEATKWLPHLRVGALYGIPSNVLGAQLATWIRRGGSPYDDQVVLQYPVQPGRRIKIELRGTKDLMSAFRLITQLDLIVVNYDICGPMVPLEGERRQLDHGWTPVLRALPLRGAVGDELHMIKTLTALRTRAACEVSASVDPDGVRIGMSGSLVLNHRSELAAQLEFIGRLQEFGGAKAVGQTSDIAARLRARCMVRRRKADVLPELPAREHAPVVLGREDLDPKVMREYDRAEADLLGWIADQARQLASEMGEDPESAAVRARLRAGGSQYLRRINVLRQLAMRAKIKAADRWITEFLKSGEKLLVFAEHLEPLDQFAASFDAPIIKGSVSPEKRQRIVERFQNHADPQLVVLQIAAGGVGLTMTAASNVMFVEQSWSPLIHDQAIDRCYGRLNDLHGAVGWYLLAEGTIDEWISELLAIKRRECEDALDGDLTDEDIESTSVYAGLVDRLASLAAAVDRR